MAWFKKEKTPIASVEEKRVKTEGLWTKCESCKQIIWKKDLAANFNVCPKCNFHFKMDARERLKMLFDDGVFFELDSELATSDPLQFKDTKQYRDRLRDATRVTGLKDAIISGDGALGGRPIIIQAMEYRFIGGSMGAVVGEKIVRAIELCLERRCPLVIVSVSGGARMMEGAISLMQLARISAGLAHLDDAHVPFISILTDPTTGGVTASFAMLGDLNVAEPGALIGFAGPRVINQTIRQKLPEGFQRSEFLLEHGMLDAIVSRKELRQFLIQSLDFMMAA
ncbi:MAG: acetyl-CoA carboxylase, carboxyltransferase subunit beta [Terriglobia bacterium]